MTGRRSTAIFVPILLVSIANVCVAGPVNEGKALVAPPVNNSTRAITETDPGPDAWALWNRMSEGDVSAPSWAMDSLSHQESTPVAPMPPALLTGGSVLLAGGILRLTRKLRLR